MKIKNKPNITILLIDDNPTNLEVLYSTLSHYNYEILVEMNGESCIQQAQENLPDLILLDVMMPGIDGFETCRQLKENPLTQDIPIIFMTALSDTINKVKGLHLGAVDYITKPFQQEEVIARIQVHLKLHQVTQELEQEKQTVQVQAADLQNTLAALKETQLQLIQQEKMSSLGQLVAGIAHEINNPVNFISGNIHHVENYTQDLLDMIHFCQKKYSNDSEFQDMIEEIDLEFIMADLPQLVSSMKMGVTRISEIVKSLRNFSRLDEALIKKVDIHEGIESTLLILTHRLNTTPNRPEIEVIKDYGNLPLFECNVRQINQVFMSLLTNAIDALDEKAKTLPIHDYNLEFQRSYQIIIQTTVIDSSMICISIKDNGTGICEAIQHKIFDPFFTTKPVGQGTGLGLSVSYQIITERHHGRLICISEAGKGSEFLIEIPIPLPSEQLNSLPMKKKLQVISNSAC